MRFLILLLLVSLFSCQRQVTLNLPASDRPVYLWEAAWSPDGKYIAIGGNIDTLRILSAKDFTVVKTYAIHETITKVRWHPTKPLLAVATQTSKDGLVLVDYEADNLQYIPGAPPSGGRGLGWNSTGEVLAFGDNEGDIHFFSATGKLLRKVSTGQKTVIDLSWHPKRNELATVSEDISRYNYDQDSFLPIIKDRPEETLMLCVAWHPSGEFFVSGDYGDFEKDYPPLLRYWTADGTLLHSIERSKAEYRNLRWSPDGSTLASSSEAVRLWSSKGELLAEQVTPDLLWGVDWSPDGKRLVTSGDVGAVSIWTQQLRLIATTEE